MNGKIKQKKAIRILIYKNQTINLNTTCKEKNFISK